MSQNLPAAREPRRWREPFDLKRSDPTMSKQIVMKNPRFNSILVELEHPIWALNQIQTSDREMGDSTYCPTDSAAKTGIRRAMGYLKNRPPKPIPTRKEKDQWINNLAKNLRQACQFQLSQGVSKGDLLICFAAIEDSIKTHTVGDPWGYLKFLDGFFSELGARIEEIDEESAMQLLESE